MTDVPSSPTAVADRLATLEQRVVRLRLLSWLALLLGGGAMAWSLKPAPPPITEGRLWLARDEAGRIRGMFGVSNDGVALTMYDSTGQMRLDVGLAPGGVPGIMLLSKRGEPVATVQVPELSAPVIRLTNVADSTRIEMAPRPGQAPIAVETRGRGDTLIARKP